MAANNLEGLNIKSLQEVITIQSRIVEERAGLEIQFFLLIFHGLFSHSFYFLINERSEALPSCLQKYTQTFPPDFFILLI